MPTCPFKIGEIAVFNSSFRFQTYVAQVMPVHIEFWGSGWLPHISKATPEQKRLWYESEEHEVIL